jgi:hypothetical protein
MAFGSPRREKKSWNMLGSGISPVLDESLQCLSLRQLAKEALTCPCQHLKDKATVIEIQKSANNGCQYCKYSLE